MEKSSDYPSVVKNRIFFKNALDLVADRFRLHGIFLQLLVIGSGYVFRAIAERFLREGAKVVVNGSSQKGAVAVGEWKSRGYGDQVAFFRLDIGLIDELPKLAAFATECFGKLDILVNNAEIETARSVYEMTREDWKRVHEVNLESFFFLSQEAAKIMRQNHYGRIVNMSSIQDLFGAPLNAHYAATKAAIIQLTRSFAIELADDGIMVNAIAPGVIHTPMSFIGGVDETETDVFKEIYVKHGKIPLRRPEQASEVASTALFLASDECQYMTGQTLVVDGGLSVTW